MRLQVGIYLFGRCAKSPYLQSGELAKARELVERHERGYFLAGITGHRYPRPIAVNFSAGLRFMGFQSQAPGSSRAAMATPDPPLERAHQILEHHEGCNSRR